MAKKIVDLNPIIKELADWCLVTKGLECRTLGIVIDRLRAAPAVDAVEVVRCKDCKNYCHDERYGTICIHPELDFDIECYAHWVATQPDDFCSYGERKDNDI